MKFVNGWSFDKCPHSDIACVYTIHEYIHEKLSVDGCIYTIVENSTQNFECVFNNHTSLVSSKMAATTSVDYCYFFSFPSRHLQ